MTVVNFQKPFSEIPNTERLPAGKYLMTLDSWSAPVQSASGKWYVDAQFVGEAGKHSERYFLTEAAQWRVKQLTSGCGYDSDTIPANMDLDVLLGSQLWITLEDDKNGDKVYAKIKKVEQATGEPKRPWPTTVRAQAQSVPVQAEPVQARQADVGTEEELPF
jgi:hypothetical protein